MNTNSLSPAAQAVLDAFVDAAYGSTFEMRQGIAAALRAAVERRECDMPEDNAYAAGYYEALGEVEAIAAELENGNG